MDWESMTSDEVYLAYRRAGVAELEAKTTKRAAAREMARRREALAIGGEADVAKPRQRKVKAV